MLDINVLFTASNYAIIKDEITQYIWLYSYAKPIAYWNGERLLKYNKKFETPTNKKHYESFKNRLTEFRAHGKISS